MLMAISTHVFKRLYVFLFVFHVVSYGYWWDQYDLNSIAVVKVSVADMLMNVASYYTAAMPKALYKSLPLSCEPKGFPCVRVHQMLFNELFFDAVCTNDECSGKIPNAFYGYNTEKDQPLNSYCSLATNMVFLADLAQKNLLKYVPAPYGETRYASKILTLKLPWKDSATGMRFSAGTRFVRAPKHDRPHSFAVRYVQFDHMKAISAFIPKDRCLLHQVRDRQQQRVAFVALIRSWIEHASPRIIPYVLGGSSYLAGVDDTRPYLKEQSILGQKAAVYKRKETHKPCWGLDCSELIWRATQIVGIRYPWKSSLMVERFLKPLGAKQQVEVGDVIWVPGHVMIVSDVARNMLIESVGYQSGFGKVHEIALKDRIKGCGTYTKLVRLMRAQQPITFIGENGSTCADEPCKFKILKLPV
jgi:hypothetical protein